MNRRVLLLVAPLLLVVGGAGFSFFRESTTGESMSAAAMAFTKSLDGDQQKIALKTFDDPSRVGWHFIPMDERKGLQIKHMTEEQKKVSFHLLQTALSEAGYKKATTIMSLEKLLNELEGGKGRNIRDYERYYVTLFGDIDQKSKWGLSFEGHHMSLNFVVENGKVVSSTPQFMAANPATIKNENRGGFEVGLRVLAFEEQLAFDLVNSLNDKQRGLGIIDKTAPAEIRAAGEPQPPTDKAVGIPASDLSTEQQGLLRKLISEYTGTMPESVAKERWEAIDAAGFGHTHFAWAGSLEPGVGHYYRVQGPTFLIEFVNTQPDAAGNPANHIHCVWRDMRGDFALPIPAQNASK